MEEIRKVHFWVSVRLILEMILDSASYKLWAQTEKKWRKEKLGAQVLPPCFLEVWCELHFPATME